MMRRQWLVAAFLVGHITSARNAAAGKATVENGMFTLRFHYQYFPTTTNLSDLRAQVERARMQLCDATDTTVKIKKVVVSFGGASEEDGDVWLLPQPGRSFASLLNRHVTLFTEGGAYSSGTIAHELGHYLLGLGDSYREDIRRHDGCGTGPNFDPGFFTPENNTIMQDSASVCRLPDGRPLGDLNPNWQRCVSRQVADFSVVVALAPPAPSRLLVPHFPATHLRRWEASSRLAIR